MPKNKYYYSQKTLRYERAGRSAFNIALTLLGYLSFGFLFFIGLVIVQNYFVQTPLEKSLRAENGALAHHKVILTSKLKEANNQLDSLKSEIPAINISSLLSSLVTSGCRLASNRFSYS